MTVVYGQHFCFKMYFEWYKIMHEDIQHKQIHLWQVYEINILKKLCALYLIHIQSKIEIKLRHHSFILICSV